MKKNFMFFTTFMAFMVCALGSQNQTPVFKSKIEVIQLDVSVLDKHRQPVRGLTQQDFTIFEDNKPQPIVGFATFDADSTAPPATGWMKDVAPDVATNEYKESRLFVLVMDDALIPQDPFAIKSSKAIAASIIDKLGPDDLTAIVFTGDNRKTQDFTTDKNKLRAALDKFNPGLATYRFGLDSGLKDDDLQFYQSTIRTLDAIADHLSTVAGRRKMVFWVSPGVAMDIAGAVPTDKDGCPVPQRWDPKTGSCASFGPTGGVPPPICITGPGTCGVGLPLGVYGQKLPPFEMTDLTKRVDEVFRKAQRANVTIYPIDPNGLDGSKNYLSTRLGPFNQGFAGHKATSQLDFLTMTATNTGGRAILNTNEFDTGIKEVFAENDSYYFIAFEPTNAAADGKLRRLQVKVNRPDVEIRTRSAYYAPEPPKTDKKSDKNALPPETEALRKAMGGILPMAGMPMRASVAPFAVPGQRLSTVTVVLGITQPIPEAAAKGRITETTDLLTSAYTPEGDPKGAQKHQAKVQLAAGSSGDAMYEALARIDLPPGRYSLRLAAHNSTSNRDGSVFTDVIVPDYSNIPFSASPIVLGATPGRKSAPKDLFSPLLPFAPTAEREFARTDKVKAFLRLYQSGQKPIEGVRLSIRVRDASDEMKVNESKALSVEQFSGIERPTATPTPTPGPGPGMVGSSIVVQPRGLATPTPQATDQFANYALRTADVSFDIPINKLAPGPYLFTVEATLGTTTIRRDVRFSVR